MENTQKGDKLGEIPKAQEPYVLSYAQERLWFIESYENGTSAYHIPMIYKIRADIDIARLKIALIKLVERHEILRTIFVRDETGKISQKVLNKVFQIHDSIDMNRPFNLYEEFPIRVAINTNKIQILIHHIAFDGWSREIFLKELKLFYNDQILPKLNTQYKDFASWQRSLSLNTSLDYWRNVLLEYKLLEMPTDYPRPKIYDYRGGRVNFKLDFHKLQFLSQSYGVTLYTVLLLVTGIMLSRYSNQNDFIIGTPVANRAHPQLSELIGLFVNTLVIRFELEADKNFEENAKKLHAKILEAQLHQDLPFERLVDALGVERDLSRHPLIQVMFNVQYSEIQQNDWLTYDGELDSIAKFDLNFNFGIIGQECLASIGYSKSLFKEERILQIAEHLQSLFQEILENKLLRQYKMLTDIEYQRIVYEWNQTEKDFPKEKTIHVLFSEQAKKTPNNIALIYEEEKLTYQELDESSNQLARLIKHEQASEMVCLCLDRSLEMVISILGVLKAGCAYVPIDVNIPDARLKHILSDTKANLVLTQSFIEKTFTIKRLNMDEKPYLYESSTPLQNKVSPKA
ncbi:hypothetical protein EBU95_19050 [bacterium]|nr:hypothetical protein [bacterium]